MAWLRGALLLSGGVCAGMLIGLMAVGPGNLFPIVLAINIVMVAPALIVGAAVGEVVFYLRASRS